MQTLKAKTATSLTENSCQSSELKDRRFNGALGQELLATSALTVMGTVALVGIHHRYRKQRQPDARLQDYVTSARAQLHSLPSATKPPLMRLRYACQQGAAAWRQAYHTYSTENKGYDSSATDFSAIHTTTLLARPIYWVSGVASMPKNIVPVKGKNDTTNASDFGVVGIDADRQIVWQTTMPERVHDIVVQPVADAQHELNYGNNNNNQSNTRQSRDVVVMGRRPSEKFWVLDTATGQVKSAIQASANRHFYGHACYSLDGTKLYVTENDTISLDGKIGIYDAHNHYQKIAEFDSRGIGPHELIMHPDGNTLVIANGGIKTERASREELNLDTMRPSLVYLNRHDGSLLEQIAPEHNQMSVRHLAMHDDGTVMIGIQFQGAKHINVPLVLTHKRGETDFRPLTMPNNQWQRFHQYIASVSVDSKHNLLCVTTPIGGCAAIFDLNTRTLIDTVSLPDCAGASVLLNNSSSKPKQTHEHSEKAGFIVSDGQGQLTTLSISDVPAADKSPSDGAGRVMAESQLHLMSFDNHLQAL
ncbi:DUF1513 domain-containing protein [Psychrobacter aquaticus]|uniref:Putative exported protein n=1 Tax=Psychrobacter aquaticus CMS 56 TaxID=1354303 RepID=U4TC31_9GAMM|nr:DUF1513 domain-containing protein [Psychrobacter aquaticus]ERL56033.1 putative exported protein [Psychrobacter aquaticus CMS 56]